MSEEIKLRIKNSTYNVIENKISNKGLKDLILKYIDYQSNKGFPFAELLVLHYQMFKGKKLEEIYPIAAAVELLILSFDILDDAEDGDAFKKPWANEMNVALNASTAMIFICVEVLRESELEYKENAISLLTEAALTSIAGQHEDLRPVHMTEKEYIRMTLEKSGSLVSLACLVGTALAVKEIPFYTREYSKSIGLIAQINNDLADLNRWDQKNDLLNKKVTLPILYLLNRKDRLGNIIRGFYEGSIKKNEVISKRAMIEKEVNYGGVSIYTNVLKKIYHEQVKKQVQYLQVDQYFIERLLMYTN